VTGQYHLREQMGSGSPNVERYGHSSGLLHHVPITAPGFTVMNVARSTAFTIGIDRHISRQVIDESISANKI